MQIGYKKKRQEGRIAKAEWLEVLRSDFYYNFMSFNR